jgi:DNA-binding NarL/FixJ family response regulator
MGGSINEGAAANVVILIKMKSRLVREALHDLLKTELDDADIYVADGFAAGGCCPDIFLVDHNNLCRDMVDQLPNAKTLLIDTGLEQEQIVNLLLSYRIDGVLSTELEPTLIKKALKQVSDGEVWIDNSIMKSLLSKAGTMSASGHFMTISCREQQIVDFIVKGFRNKEIAEHLFLSEQTVKAHLSRIFKKYNVSSRAQLIALLAFSPHETIKTSSQ